MAATTVPIAYQNLTASAPDWLNKGDNAWQMMAATVVGLQSVPGLVILYGSIVKKKWAVNSAFMALYAFAAVIICWVTWAYKMSFGEKLLPFWGKAGPALGQKFLIRQAELPATTHHFNNGTVQTAMIEPFFPMASMVWYQCVFACITLILLAGSLLGRMNIKAWMMFVPLWLTFSYTVGAFSLWGGGFLFQWGVIDYTGGFVIHLSSGIAGLTAAYWVGPRSKADRERFPPNNILLMLAGAGLLWMGWAGFNGGGPYTANIDSSMAILNTNICAATSLLVWTWLDVIFFKKPSVIGAVQGMITGLVCITPGAGTYNISIDAERGLADITGQVDPNAVLYALAQSGQHAELVRIKLQHPASSYNNQSYYYGGNGLEMNDVYGMVSPYGTHPQSYPMHDPYWYSRRPHAPSSFSHPSHYRRYPYRTSTSSYGFANHLPPPIRNGCYHHHHGAY